MTQNYKRNLSSEAKQLKAELKNTSDPNQRLRLCLLHIDAHLELSQLEWRRELPILLRELANLGDDRVSVFRFIRFCGWRFYWETPEGYLNLRNELRAIWNHSPDAPNLLNAWLTWRPSEMDMIEIRFRQHGDETYAPFVCSLRDRSLVPNFISLRGALIQGVLEHYGRLRICEMPNCPAPYFVARRNDQRICDSGDCKAQKQRLWALDYWNREGSKKRKPAKKKKITKEKLTRGE